ncbi:MAG: hypothetical protein ACOYMB_01770 [Patescibacteria group bacterium]
MATEQQIPIIAGRIVEYQKYFSDLPNDDAQWFMNHTKEGIALCVAAISNRVKEFTKTEKILSRLVLVSSCVQTVKRFITRDKFVVNTGCDSKLKISCLDNNFRSWFLDKVEDVFLGSTIQGVTLMSNSVNSQIINELGGEERVETSLTELYSLMEAQPNGKMGDLVIKWDQANIFYVRDINGTLRAIRLVWFGDGWDVEARPISSPNPWISGIRIFSRHPSSLTS